MAREEKSVEEISEMFQLNAHNLTPECPKQIHEIQSIGVVKPSNFDQYLAAARSDAGFNVNFNNFDSLD